MVILPVACDKLLVGKVRNVHRIAAGHMPVAVVREQQPFELIIHDRLRGRERALHLVEHDALIAEVVALALVAPALLPEDLGL